MSAGLGRRAALRLGRVALAVGFGLALWQALVWVTGLPHFILPGPGRVAQSLVDNVAMIAVNARFTIQALLTGLAAGVALGVLTAVQLALSPGARLMVRPLLIFAQAIPIFALAPVITLWLGYGAGSKIVIVMLVTYFPVTSAFFDGLMRMPPGMADLSRVMGAGPLRELWHLRLPQALPALGSGLRLGAVYAPFGVVIGEWVGSSRGLGYLMLLANGRAQTDLMFAALITLAAFNLVVFLLIDRLARGLEARFG
ncbi:ABC transporter permease [Alkalilacustris brevis]|uniref:ABC transporter permease n=1 Tax=Alkalilacustris brevis TaxID=2026338 RepID=UPI000E0CC571|nr:ABC transporter permease [Alkalilacustris brevis]